jgi:uncharacterized protein YndB with AHSA1/START domain
MTHDTPVVALSRRIHAQRAKVFAALTRAEAVQAWFAPAPWIVAEAQVDPRLGGTWDVLMQGPDGGTHWTRGVITALVPDQHLAIDMVVHDGAGTPLFHAATTLDLADAFCGTEIAVRQTYTLLVPALAEGMVGGAQAGWTIALAQMEQAALRLAGVTGTVTQPTVHGQFTLERRYPAPPAKVWRALTEAEAKAAWFSAPEGQAETIERVLDLRVGGRECLKARWASGMVTHFEAVYHDIVPAQRLVYAYAMMIDAQKISVSLATIELAEDGAGTWLRMTEQGAFLDGYDDAGSREHGTGVLLDMLGTVLAQTA